MLATETRMPTSDIDPFSDAFLNDPYPFHHALREAGPVVRLERHGVSAMARHAQVSAALADWQTFSSGAGVGIDDFRKGRPWRPASLLLEVDPPLHTRTRTVMNRVLAAPALRGLRETFGAEAARLADRLVAKRRFDAIQDLAEAYPLQVFPDAVGVRQQGRENLLPYGTMVFNSFGPRNALFRASEAECAPVLQWIYDSCARDALAPEGFGAAIWAAHDRGEIEESEAHILVRALLTAGLDTTVNGLGSAILAFAQHPDQWQALRDDNALLKVAFDEVLRWESPVQTFFRTTTRPAEIEGIEIAQDEKVLLFLAAANRDPRSWEEPEKFDIRRRPSGHVALGNGIHVCVGQMVARLEAEMMLGALAERVSRIDIVGEPKRKLNNTLRSLASLPVEVTPL
ncbi:MAG: cytochrome P450 [Beijerinckiaceae bacterium]